MLPDNKRGVIMRNTVNENKRNKIDYIFHGILYLLSIRIVRIILIMGIMMLISYGFGRIG